MSRRWPLLLLALPAGVATGCEIHVTTKGVSA